jgi:hypothetical protein
VLRRIQKLQNAVTIEQSVLSHASKLVGMVLRGRIEKKIEDIFGPKQFEFRGGKGTWGAENNVRIIFGYR